MGKSVNRNADLTDLRKVTDQGSAPSNRWVIMLGDYDVRE